MSDLSTCDICERNSADKETWGPGPWQNEGNYKLFEYGGLTCLLHRSPTGAWCGYVALPPGHPYHGLSYYEVYDKQATLGLPAEGVLRVHGGLTYAEKCNNHICHTPKPGEPDDVWWLGFDCGHAGDHLPARNDLVKTIRSFDVLDRVFNEHLDYECGGRYWTESEVQYETERLAEVLAFVGARTR